MKPRDVFRAYWRHARAWGERPELLPPPAARSFRMQYSAVLCLRSRMDPDETALAFRRILRARAHRAIDGLGAAAYR